MICITTFITAQVFNIENIDFRHYFPSINNYFIKKIKQMKTNLNYRYIIKNDACEFDLQQTFNQLSMFTLNPP